MENENVGGRAIADAPVAEFPTKAVIAGAIGTMLEWYDLITFGYLAAYLGSAFFPKVDPTISLLESFAAFGVGFLARPLGGLVFGAYADRKGRTASLMMTMVLMGVSTGVIGVLPGYATIGLVAPVILVVARLVQGMSAGGEGNTALAFLSEWAPAKRRGLIVSLQAVGGGCGLFLGSMATTTLVSLLPPDAVQAWGWRIPFLIGTFIAPIGLLIRMGVDDPPIYQRVMESEKPTKRTNHALGTLNAFVFLIFGSICYYIFLVYMPTLARTYLHFPAAVAFRSNTIALLAYIAFVPAFGYLSDLVGRKPVLLMSCLGFILLPYPVWTFLMHTHSVVFYTFFSFLFATFVAMYWGPGCATVTEFFGTHGRAQWLGLGYGLSVAIFGGFTPLFVTWSIRKLDNPLAAAYYVIASALIGSVFIVLIKETARKELD